MESCVDWEVLLLTDYQLRLQPVGHFVEPGQLCASTGHSLHTQESKQSRQPPPESEACAEDSAAIAYSSYELSQLLHIAHSLHTICTVKYVKSMVYAQ